MSVTQYVLAKHVPDVFRKEPKNIGIIVWSESGIESRFWALDSYGAVDFRKVPEFVNSKPAYEQWVHFWLKELAKPEVNFIGSNETASVRSAEFLDAIRSGNSDNFFLCEGGAILEEVTKEQLPKLADELFEMLVTAEAVDEPDTTTFIHEACEKVLKTTRLSSSRNLMKGRILMPKISPTHVESIRFSYCYGNGAPLWLGQQVPLKRYKSQLSREVDSTCWRFEKVIKAEFIEREQGAIFVYPSDDQLNDRDVKNAIDLMGTVTRVFNLRDSESARKEFDRVAAIPVPEHH